MKITLRQVELSDLAIIQNWYETINGGQYTSRYGPKVFDGKTGCNQEAYVWYVIQADEQDCGVIWLEKDEPTKDEAVLGIMLGNEADFGQGIGQAAIWLVLTKALSYLTFDKVCLHVRKNNARAIACYTKCGFRITDEGEKIVAGQKLEFFIMHRN